MTTIPTSIYDLPLEILKRIPRTYREWTLLSLCSKELAGRLGDYHEHHGITFLLYGRSTTTLMSYAQYVGRVRPGTYPSGITARDRHGNDIMFSYLGIWPQAHTGSRAVMLWTFNAPSYARLEIAGELCYAQSIWVNDVARLFYDELPAVRVRGKIEA